MSGVFCARCLTFGCAVTLWSADGSWYDNETRKLKDAVTVVLITLLEAAEQALVMRNTVVMTDFVSRRP